MENQEKNIWDLQIHETMTVLDSEGYYLAFVIRVPGGLLYQRGQGLAFVPFEPRQVFTPPRPSGYSKL